VHEVEVTIQALPTCVVVRSSDREIIFSISGSDPQYETPAGNLIERRGLFCKQHGIACRREQDVRHQSDARGCARRGTERDQFLITRKRIAADGCQRRKSEVLGAPCNVDEQTTIFEALVRVG
jgi:hypothetical protein